MAKFFQVTPILSYFDPPEKRRRHGVAWSPPHGRPRGFADSLSSLPRCWTADLFVIFVGTQGIIGEHWGLVKEVTIIVKDMAY